MLTNCYSLWNYILWYHKPISILHRPHYTLYTKFKKFHIDQFDFTYYIDIVYRSTANFTRWCYHKMTSEIRTEIRIWNCLRKRYIKNEISTNQCKCKYQLNKVNNFWRNQQWKILFEYKHTFILARNRDPDLEILNN